MNMNYAKTLLMASAMAAATLAQAQALVSVNTTLFAGGATQEFYGFGISNLSGSGSLTFSKGLIGALSVAGIETQIIGPATGAIARTSIQVNAPITSLSGGFTADGWQVNGAFTATGVSTQGGVTMTAGAPNFATTGGSLSVTDISVDLRTKGIYANVAGANGLRSQRVRVWDYANIEGPLTFAPVAGTSVVENKLTGLKITTQAFELFAQGLGLEPGGRAAMGSIADYGVMTSRLESGGPSLSPLRGSPGNVALIPEPSIYLMMGLGLTGLAMLRRGRRST